VSCLTTHEPPQRLQVGLPGLCGLADKSPWGVCLKPVDTVACLALGEVELTYEQTRH
jgi:hypothetical protein